MRNVIFVAPFPLENTYRFVRAAARMRNVNLLGIVARPPAGKDASIFADIITVEDAFDLNQLILAAKTLQGRHGKIHRILGILEPLQVPIAKVRQALGVKGTTPEIADLFRDKGRMKDELRKHGLPCARHKVLTSWTDAQAFAQEIGFPMVVKPTDGMACKATWRINDVETLQSAFKSMNVSEKTPAIAEEFLRGKEFSFETITIGGEVKFTSISRYFPTPLEAMENPWIQWAVVHPQDLSGPVFDRAHEIGIKAVKALGLETGFTHMEWFEREDGSIAIGEIAARPPGAQIMPGLNFVHEADFYLAWARAVIDDAFDGPFKRKFSVGVAFLRGVGRGRVRRVLGVEKVNAQIGSLVVESKLPQPGTPRSDSYEGDGHIIVRHPDVEIVKKALSTIISTIRVDYV